MSPELERLSSVSSVFSGEITNDAYWNHAMKCLWSRHYDSVKFGLDSERHYMKVVVDCPTCGRQMNARQESTPCVPCSGSGWTVTSYDWTLANMEQERCESFSGQGTTVDSLRVPCSVCQLHTKYCRVRTVFLVYYAEGEKGEVFEQLYLSLDEQGRDAVFMVEDEFFRDPSFADDEDISTDTKA